MTSTTEPQNKRSEELSVIEIEELLNDVWAKLPLEAKRSIMLDHIEQATLAMLERVSSRRKLIEKDSLREVKSFEEAPRSASD